MSVDTRRLMRAFVLGAWALFFTYLRISGAMTRYLGPRTYWVVTFGAIALGGAALAHVVTLRAPGRRSGPTLGELSGAAVLLVPIAAVLMIPSAELGALAASKKLSSAGGGQVGAFAPQVPSSGAVISFAEIHYADQSADYAAQAGIVEGTPVRLVGFVTHDPNAPQAGFALTRFYVSCCAADALPFSVRIRPPAGFVDPHENDWIEVKGRMARDENGLFLDGEEAAEVPEPAVPYLY